MIRASLILTALSICLSTSFATGAERPPALQPVHTYSIVARDPETGELGVAVQSHYFGVGSRVVWAEPGVGVVATQSFTNPAFGPDGLRLMREGSTAEQALNELLEADARADVRQVGMVDADGNVANHTGQNSIREYCDLTGDGYAVQANLMWKPIVCEAMVRGYESAEGDLAERMMIALESAEAVGGDIRGMQSAALLIVSGDASEPAWGGRIFDLRIEDHKEPLLEMRRLLTTARAYQLMNDGDKHMAAGDADSTIIAYEKASTLLPDNHEIIFWYALTLAANERVDESLPLFSKAFSMWPLWRELIQRMPASGLLPDDPELMQRIISVE